MLSRRGNLRSPITFLVTEHTVKYSTPEIQHMLKPAGQSPTLCTLCWHFTPTSTKEQLNSRFKAPQLFFKELTRECAAI